MRRGRVLWSVSWVLLVMQSRRKPSANRPVLSPMLFVLSLLAILGASPPVAAGATDPVRVSLLADHAAVTSHEAFQLGLLLHMQSGWHTYWRASGDAGMPTRVTWSAPAGTRIGALRWPLPRRYSEAGGLTAYGYADEVMLLARVEPPADVVPGDSLVITAAVSWLACAELCVPGDTLLRIVLPVAASAATSPQRALFARYGTTVPGPLSSSAGLGYSVRTTGRALQVEVWLAGDEVRATEPVDLYPYNCGGDDRDGEPGYTLDLRPRPGSPPGLVLEVHPLGADLPDTLRGVVLYTVDEESARRAGTVALALTPTPPPVQSSVIPDVLERDLDGIVLREQRPLVAYLLLGLLGGLILNLMPCVLPVISLKILGFVSQAGEERARARQLGLAFSGGILMAFLALAGVVILLQAGGEQVGWGFQFQRPLFVMLMSALIFALALSLFGVFTINIAVGGAAARQGEGLGGAFFSGMLATVLATPCTAPFLGSALGFAFSQPAAVILAVFAVIGVGMALPYVLLALEPAWLRFLPRPGTWMERFKQLMGFLLMATVLWLLWVLAKQVGGEGVVWTGGYLLVVALACWVVGQWIDLSSSRWKRLVTWIVAVLLLLLGGISLLGRALESSLRPSIAAAANTVPGGNWEAFSSQRVAELLAAGDHHVFIDFTAEWCWTCKVNEQTALASDAVRRRFQELGVILIRADWTARDREITAALAAFGRSGVPLYVLFPAGRAHAPLVLSEVITAQMVLDRLDEAERISAVRGAK